MGLRVLAHEAAHAHQQANASLPPLHQLRVASPKGPEEAAADSFANGLGGKTVATPPGQISAGSVARVMRLTFETGNEAPIPVPIGGKSSFRELSEHTFGFGWCAPALLTWKTGPVTVRGTPEPGSDWKVGMTQLLKDYWFRIWWGPEESPTITRGGGPWSINLRDGMSDSGPWFDDIVYDKKRHPEFEPKQTTKPFVQDGDSDPVGGWFEDSPGWLNLPYQHPDAKEPQAFGGFDFGSTFSAYISAYNSKSGEFQHLKRVNWQAVLAGTFDQSRPKDQRLTVARGGEPGSLAVMEGPFENEKEPLLRKGASAYSYLTNLPELMQIPQRY